MANQNPTGSATAVLAAATPNTSYTIYEADLLRGFSATNGSTLYVASLTAENGEIADVGKGEWQFFPAQNFTGIMTLNYSISDTKGSYLRSETTSLNASAPITSYPVYETSLLQGFSDPNGDALNVASLSADNGEVIDLGNGQWQLVPAKDFFGTITLNYLVTDRKGGDIQGTLPFNITSPQSPPTGSVTISGTAQQNQTLTANTSTIADANGLGAFSYQWLSNGTVLSTSNSYALTQTDVGKNISVKVSYFDGLGKAESVTSNAVTVSNVNDSPTGGVSILGTPTQGQILIAAHNLQDLDGLGTISYQWLSNNSEISGATQSSYTLTASDVGKTISVKARYTDLQGTPESVTSNATQIISPPQFAPTGEVTILGTVEQNQTLTVSNTLADQNGIVSTISYQWLLNGVAVSNSNSYPLTQNEVGKNISVTASYTDGLKKFETLTSKAVTVSNVNDSPTGKISIEGDLQVGKTLRVKTDDVKDADGLGTFNFQWLRDEKPIEGQTAKNYVLAKEDSGKNIAVQLSYTDKFGTLEKLDSAPVSIAATLVTLTAKKNFFKGIGNDADNVQGSVIADSISGVLGNDTLRGADGNDTIDGGNDNDQIFGEADSDLLKGGDGDDLLNGGDDNDTLDAGNGNDTLDGAFGADKMTGGDGDDVYFVENIDDEIIESTAVTGGNDTVHSAISWQTTVGIENINLTGVNDLDAAGDDKANIIKGNSGNNLLKGLAGNDTLFGNSGNDTLDGGAGEDELNGGQGDDVYFIDNIADVINDDSGKDSVQSSTTVSLAIYPTIENLDLIGNTPIKGTGNQNHNIINGNAADNELKGMEGNDSLFGHAGDDTLIGGEGNDVLDGGNDEDTVVYNGNSSDYFAQIADTVTVNNMLKEETDELIDIEFIKFDDQVLPIIGQTQELVLSVADVKIKEGNKNNGTVKANVVLTLDKAPEEDVSVAVTTEDITATVGEDYKKFEQIVTFKANQKTQKLNLEIKSDLLAEDDETFALQFSNPSDGVTLENSEAIVTILNDDKPKISIQNATVSEGEIGKMNAQLQVNLSTASNLPVTVSYKTVNSTAKSSSDYSATSGKLTFDAGETSKTILVPIVDDKIAEKNEEFRVTLSSAKNATLETGKSTAKVTIIDNDKMTTSSQEITDHDANVEIELTGLAENFVL